MLENLWNCPLCFTYQSLGSLKMQCILILRWIEMLSWGKTRIWYLLVFIVVRIGSKAFIKPSKKCVWSERNGIHVLILCKSGWSFRVPVKLNFVNNFHRCRCAIRQIILWVALFVPLHENLYSSRFCFSTVSTWKFLLFKSFISLRVGRYYFSSVFSPSEFSTAYTTQRILLLERFCSYGTGVEI